MSPVIDPLPVTKRAGPIFLRSADGGCVRQNDGLLARFEGLLGCSVLVEGILD